MRALGWDVELRLSEWKGGGKACEELRRGVIDV